MTYDQSAHHLNPPVCTHHTRGPVVLPTISTPPTPITLIDSDSSLATDIAVAWNMFRTLQSLASSVETDTDIIIEGFHLSSHSLVRLAKSTRQRAVVAYYKVRTTYLTQCAIIRNQL